MIRAFVRSRSGMLGLVLLAVIILVVVLGPPLFGDQSAATHVLHQSEKPSGDHLLGTDRLGRDVLERLLVATRLSIGLALLSAAIAAAIGIPYGALSALMPARLRTVALRAIDAALAFPALLIAIFIAAVLTPSGKSAALGVGLALSSQFARVSSTLALSISRREFVEAARVAGISGPRRMFRYVLPNMAEALIITSTVAIGNCILFVSSLSYLGLGVQPPQADWGSMLSQGIQDIYVTPVAAVAPAVAIAFAAIAFGFVGEALARAMNPLLWARRTAPAAGRRRLRTHSMLAGPKVTQALALNAPVHDNGQQRHQLANDLVLEVADLSVSFESARVVDGVSFTLAKGERLGIVGESGSGKTMTAMAVAQLIPHPGTVSGTVTLLGRRLDELKGQELDHLLGTELAVVFQDPLSSLNPALRIGTQVIEASVTHRDIGHSEASALAVEELREVNLPTPELQMRQHPHELSGGQRQRVMIAMGLMNEPALLVADEPTTALDVTIQAQIMDLLADINARHDAAMILISHNLGLISQNCQRVIVMYAGRVVEELTVQQLLTRPRHPYTRALLAATPEISADGDGAPLRSIPGQVPDFLELPSGCAFHPRCPLATELCRSERPQLRWVDEDQRAACWVAAEESP